MAIMQSNFRIETSWRSDVPQGIEVRDYQPGWVWARSRCLVVKDDGTTCPYRGNWCVTVAGACNDISVHMWSEHHLAPMEE